MKLAVCLTLINKFFTLEYMMKQRNLVAKDMFDRRSPYKAKAVGAKKGKGSFQRKPKHKDSGY